MRNTVKQLLRKFQLARETHSSWATTQRKRRTEGKKPVPLVGSETHHRRWVRVYDSAIRVLKNQ